MRINTLETNRKRTLVSVGIFLFGLGLYMDDEGTIPLVIGLIGIGIYAIDRFLEERNR